MAENPNIEQELWDDPEFRIAMAEKARAVANYATAFERTIHAPWMPRSKSKFEVKQYNRGRELYVFNTDYAAAITEWGSVNNPPYAPLRRAVRAAGLALKEDTPGTRSNFP